LIECVVRQWTHALSVFPLLSAPTAVELAGARVIALDVEEIATRGGQFSAWEASISYLLARQVAASHFYLHESSLGIGRNAIGPTRAGGSPNCVPTTSGCAWTRCTA